MRSLILIFLAFPISSFANENELKICLTGSTEKALPKYGEAFVNGASMAINELSSENKKKVKLEIHYYDSTPLAPITKLEEMRKASCDAIIGFSTGNDLLVIEESLKEKPVFTLSIYGDPQDRFDSTPYLRTMQPSAKDLVISFFKKFPLKIKKDSKVLIITAADRSEMISYKEAYISLLKDKSDLITYVDVIEQTHNLRQVEKALLDNGEWDYVVLLTRSLIAAELSDQIYSKSKPIILGTKYFGSSELPAFFNYLKNKKVQAYFSRQNCSCDSSADYQRMKAKYQQAFSVDPMSISIDSYDATKFVLQAVKASKINSEQVIHYLNTEAANFQGPSSMKVTKGLKLNTFKRFLIKIDETGYKEVK